MKTLLYSNPCKLCIEYKSVTAIPDFENEILFIYRAMACYKKRVTWLLMLVDQRFFFNLDKNYCFSVDIIRLGSDLNDVSEKNLS